MELTEISSTQTFKKKGVDEKGNNIVFDYSSQDHKKPSHINTEMYEGDAEENKLTAVAQFNQDGTYHHNVIKFSEDTFTQVADAKKACDAIFNSYEG